MEKATKAWKLHGLNGHGQRDSFNESNIYDFSEGKNIRIIEIMNADKTLSPKYSLVKITRNTVKECQEELEEQISNGILKNVKAEDVEEILSSWDEVLDTEVEWLQEEFNQHTNTANIEYFFPNYKEILEKIDSATEDYTELDTVAEKFSYSQEEWMQKIEEKFKPVIQAWFDRFCERSKDDEEHAEYIECFWG